MNLLNRRIGRTFLIFFIACALIWHRLVFSLRRKKRSENMSIIMLLRRNYYLCSKFVPTLCLHELTYSILADLSARLNLVNSTIDARIKSWQVCSLFGGHRPLCLFRIKAYQSRTEGITKGFRVLPFVYGHGGNAETR